MNAGIADKIRKWAEHTGRWIASRTKQRLGTLKIDTQRIF